MISMDFIVSYPGTDDKSRRAAASLFERFAFEIEQKGLSIHHSAGIRSVEATTHLCRVSGSPLVLTTGTLQSCYTAAAEAFAPGREIQTEMVHDHLPHFHVV